MTYKKMGAAILAVTLSLLLLIAALTIVVDPYFHYHAPFSFQTYTLNNQRYQNDGIAKHFDYDTVITGTSLTENFKASQCDELFGAETVKCCFSGGSYKEINELVVTAVKSQPKLKRVIRCIDLHKMLQDKDTMAYDSYPTYLYDDNPINDCYYLFNKDVLLGDTWSSLLQTVAGGESTTFDQYSYWNDSYTYCKESVLKEYQREEKVAEEKPFTEEDKKTVSETIGRNVTDLAAANPQIEFYYFLPPCSVVWWDSVNQTGDLQRNLEAQRTAIELMLQYDNIKLFSFVSDFDVVSDLNNYKDTIHYSAQINEKMLNCMQSGEFRLTTDTLETYCSEVAQFYQNYDYDAIFEE